MNKQYTNRETWNKLADRYENKFMDLNLYDETYDHFYAGLKKVKASLLDIGCGPGNISRYLLRKDPNLKITAIDAAPSMIEKARGYLPDTDLKVMDCREISGLNTKFDGIICGFVIPYLTLPDCAQLFADCSKLLHNNGLLYISFVPGDKEEILLLGEDQNEKMYFYVYVSEQIENLLELNSFEKISLFDKEYLDVKGKMVVHRIFLMRKIIIE